MEDLNTLVQKITTDRKFRDDLAASPQATLDRYNIKVSADVINTLKGMDSEALAELAANFSADKAAC